MPPTDLAGAADEDAALARIRQDLVTALESADGRLLAVRMTLTGATSAHAALIKDPGATRDKIRGEALAVGGADSLWLEQVVIKTSPPVALAPHDPIVNLLLERVQERATFSAELQAYAAQLLDRAPGLRDALDKAASGKAHPVTEAAAGTLDPDLEAQARALLLAELSV
jgi:hypothetical protein